MEESSRELLQLADAIKRFHPRSALLHPQLSAQLDIVQSSAIIYRSSLNNDNSLESICRCFLVESTSTVPAEEKGESHAGLMGSDVGFEDIRAFGDLEIVGWDDEVGGEGAAGYFVTLVAVADSLECGLTSEGILHFGAKTRTS